MRYQVTAIIQDNRENTQKVCAQCDEWVDAMDAIIEEICRRSHDTPDGVMETWLVIFMSIINTEDITS